MTWHDVVIAGILAGQGVILAVIVHFDRRLAKWIDRNTGNDG